MSLRKIKTYEQLDNLLFDIDYETLSDDDIERLCKKVWEICCNKIDNIKKTEVDSDIIIFAVAAETKEAADRCLRLRNCTKKRIQQNILREKAANIPVPCDDFTASEQDKGIERILH